jgi:MtN3 and saliva related transmembrane protein
VEELVPVVGGVAAFLTTASHVPQLKKCWQTRSAGDLSFKALLALAIGLCLWLAYGVMRSDFPLMIANGISLALVLGILAIKLRERRGSRSGRAR